MFRPPFRQLRRLLDWIRLPEVEGETLNVWYRAQPSRHALRPRLFSARGPLQENELVQHFMRQAPSLIEHVPPLNDNGAWLSLMQHHRLPTRLLDWTESPLIAAFHSCTGQDPHDAATESTIWCLTPGLLNMEAVAEMARNGEPFSAMSGGGHILSLAKPGCTLTPILENAFENQKWENNRLPLAVFPSHIHARMAAQQAMFTIHRGATCLSAMLAGPKQDQILQKLTLTAEQKRELRFELDPLGFGDQMVFPDLDHLASSLTRLFVP